MKASGGLQPRLLLRSLLPLQISTIKPDLALHSARKCFDWCRLRTSYLQALITLEGEDSEGYRAEIHWEVDAETKKQERLHMAMATGVLWVKFDKDSRTQSRTIED